MVSYRMAMVGLIVVGMAVPMGARAASSSGSGDGGTAGSDTGGSGTGGTSSGGNLDGTCGDTCSSTGQITFDSPTTTEVSAPVQVSVSASADCYCDDCGCFSDGAVSMTIFLDGEPVQTCPSDACSVELSPSPGAHELRADAEYTAQTLSETLAIEVLGADTGGLDATGGTSLGAATTEGGPPADDVEGKQGCGCDVEDQRGHAGVSVLALIALAGRRRRRA